MADAKPIAPIRIGGTDIHYAQGMRAGPWLFFTGHEASDFERGIAAPGESPNVFNLIPEYNSPRRFKTLADDLSRRGWPAARIDKILGANFARLFGAVWSG